MCFKTECIVTLQGHPRALILAPIESAYGTSYWSSIVTLVLSCPISEIILQLLYAETESQFFHTLPLIRRNFRGVPFGIISSVMLGSGASKRPIGLISHYFRRIPTYVTTIPQHRACDTLTRSFASYKFVTYLLTDRQTDGRLAAAIPRSTSLSRKGIKSYTQSTLPGVSTFSNENSSTAKPLSLRNTFVTVLRSGFSWSLDGLSFSRTTLFTMTLPRLNVIEEIPRKLSLNTCLNALTS